MAHAYKAFISYSHASDGKLAPALQHGLQQFARPWNQLRAIRVFRDKTGLTTTPGLWKSIVTALDSSEYFLLLASPQAAQSHWVDQEVRHWLSQPRADRLLIILTEGDIAWNTRTLDVQRTNALPPALREFLEEPLWLDLRWAKASEQVSLQNPAFREAIADLSSTLRSIPKDQLIGDDVRQHRRATLFRRSAIAGLTLLVFGLMAVAYVAFQQRNLAREQARIALARQLAAQSEMIRTSQPERFPLALLMAAEAARSDSESMEAQQSLQFVLAQFPEPLATLNVGSGPVRAAVDSEMKLLATSSTEATILWRLPDRERVATLPPFDHTVMFSADGKTLAGCCRPVEVWTASGVQKFSLDLQSFAGQPTNIALNHDGRLLAIGFEGRFGPGFEVRDLDTKQVVFRREINLSGNPPTLAFAPNGDLAVTLRTAVEILPAGASAVTTLASTIGGLTAIAYSADGHYLAWSTHEHVVVFDVREHKESARLTVDSDGPDAQVLRLTFSSDGQYLGAVGALNTGAIWRGPNWREVVAPRHAELQTIYALAFHPSVPEVVTCASDGYCISWSLSTGQKIRRFAHIHAYEGSDNTKRQIVGAEFGPVGPTLVTSGADGTARLWNVMPPGETGRSECLGTPVIETFAPRGRQWSWPFMGEPAVTPEECQIVPPFGITSYTVVTDLTGTYGAAPQPVDVVRIWDPAKKPLAEITHADPVDWEAVQQRLINRGIRSHRAYLPIIERMKREGSVRVLALSPAGKYLVTAREADEKLRIWDTASKHVVFSEPMSEESHSLFEFLSETRLLRVERGSDGKGALAIINLPSIAAEWSAPVEWPAAVTVSEDRQVIAWADGRDKQFTIRVRETSTGSPLFERKVAAEVKRLYFDRTHRFLAVSLGEQPVMPSGLPFGCGFVVWRLSDGKELATVPETDHVIAFEFSADGSSFAAVNRDGRLRVWDLDSGAVTSTVLRNPGPVAFSASAQWVAAGSGSVQILDRLSLRPVAQLDFPADTRRIEFQSEDRVLAVTAFQTGDTRGVTYLRYWQPTDLLAEACKRIPLAAAEAQWRQLFVDRPLPAPCAKQ